ncbi:MAG TPA: hypothetical protein VN133_08705 [Humibacter sp.]|nr:hypothetical protein [Humibacter sp.]
MRRYPAIDDCTRLRVLKAYPAHDLKTAIRFIDDVDLFNDRLQQWEDHHNYDRPHGALAGQTPYERLKQKTQDPLS